MTSSELKTRYDELYEKMRKSRDVSNMRLFGTAFTDLFYKVASTHPELAANTIEFLSAIEYYNFVTTAEAVEIASEFINDDTMITGNTTPSRGAHWSMDAMKSFLTQKGISLEEKPYYNWPALWLTVNMVYSDYANVFVETLGTKDNEKIATTSYKFAVKKLKDMDRKHFIREYFELD